MNPKVDFYFSKAKKWQEELEQLRTIVLDCGLTEELKWGVPCYTFQKSNIVLIHVPALIPSRLVAAFTRTSGLATHITPELNHRIGVAELCR
jgi:uncharacterized protein YdeI (YjbR/CyaY-like superfamily)